MKSTRQPVCLLRAICLLAIALVSVSSLCAQSKPAFPAYTGHINDFANVLDAATKQQLGAILLNFERRTGAQIAVVTVPTLNDRPIEDYANALYRAWGIGAKSGEHKDKGALLLVAPNDRRSRLEVGYGLEGDLPDGLAGEMLRRMRPYFQQQQWSQGLTVGVRTLVDTLAQKWNISIEGIDQQYAYAPPADTPPNGEVFGALICLLIAVVIFVLLTAMLARRRGSRRPAGWYAAPMIWNSGGGNWGSGSTGGGSWGSSGGGGSDWGGFGGGDSGGGGASDSW